MSTTSSTTRETPKHDIHKFRQLKKELTRDNWVSWKRSILACLRDRGLEHMVLGKDPRPPYSDSGSAAPRTRSHSTPDTDSSERELSDWEERNDAAYNQILLNVSTTIAPLLDATTSAKEAWSILLKRFESNNPQFAAIVRAQYETHMYKEGDPIIDYIARLEEFRTQLACLGQPVNDEAHGSRILLNLPDTDDWRLFVTTIQNLTADPVEIAEKLMNREASEQLRNRNIQSNPSMQYQRALNATTRNERSKPSAIKPPCSYCSRLGHISEDCHKRAFDILYPEKAKKRNSKSNDSNTTETYLSKVEESVPRILSL
jgi:hypothetical protein